MIPAEVAFYCANETSCHFLLSLQYTWTIVCHSALTVTDFAEMKLRLIEMLLVLKIFEVAIKMLFVKAHCTTKSHFSAVKLQKTFRPKG